MQSRKARVEERARQGRERRRLSSGSSPRARCLRQGLQASATKLGGRMRIDHLFRSASVQLALECLSITSIASSPSTQITGGTALPLSYPFNLWQVLKVAAEALSPHLP